MTTAALQSPDPLEARASGEALSGDGAGDPLAARADTPTGYDPLAARAEGRTISSAPPLSTPATPTFSTNTSAGDLVQGYFKNVIGNTAGGAAGGLHALWDLALGRGSQQAKQDIQSAEQFATSGIMAPKSSAERLGYEAASSNWNPLNWPGVALSWAGNRAGDVARRLGASPELEGAISVAPTVAAGLYGARQVLGPGNWEPYRVPAEEIPSDTQSISAAAADGGALRQGAPEPLGAPIEGGLPQTAQDARQATLSRVGITNARESAIAGDAKSAAVDYQMTKYDQPAGRAAAAQFQSERDALAAHAEKLIGDTGGTVGMEEDALANRGAAIARPFDQLREWFSDRTRQLYAQADERASGLGGGAYDTATGRTSLTDLNSVDQLLDDPSFRNTLMAKNQQGLLSAVQNQLQSFRQGNPGGFSAAGAEQMRQWLNQVWTPDNKWAIGQLKGAIDEDVTSAAGADIYAQARAIRQLRAKTLDDPKGISQLFDVDPNTPINRSTPLEKIPDRLTQLPVDQYANVIQTLKNMPEELQPDAQAALGEIKAHLLNKTLQAGTETSRGVGAQVWGADRVAKVLRTNAAKFRIAFGDDQAAQQGIEDLNNAGQILKVDQSYPGADAQAANAMKRGLISRTLGHIGGLGGGLVGGTITGGPIGAAIGAAGGESIGLSAGQKASEQAALRAWNKRVTPTAQ